MLDYNFFEGYKVKKKTKSVGVQLVNILFMLFMILLAAYMGWNYYQLMEQQNELAAVDKEIEKIKATDDIARIYEKQNLLTELTAIVDAMTAAGDDITGGNVISEDLLVTIADSLPSDVRIDSLSVNQGNISMSGDAMSKPAIAEFEYNLKAVPSFSNVFIGGIQRSGDKSFTFNITLMAGGGSGEN